MVGRERAIRFAVSVAVAAVLSGGSAWALSGGMEGHPAGSAGDSTTSTTAPCKPGWGYGEREPLPRRSPRTRKLDDEHRRFEQHLVELEQHLDDLYQHDDGELADQHDRAVQAGLGLRRPEPLPLGASGAEKSAPRQQQALIARPEPRRRSSTSAGLRSLLLRGALRRLALGGARRVRALTRFWASRAFASGDRGLRFFAAFFGALVFLAAPPLPDTGRPVAGRTSVTSALPSPRLLATMAA